MSKYSRDRHIELCTKIQQGCKKSLDILIQENLPLVMSRVNFFKSRNKRHIPIDDLTQEGCIGLIKASHKFDPSFGAKFATYARYWIDLQMRRCIDQTIRVPEHRIGQTPMYNEVRKRMAQGVTLEKALENIPLTRKEYEIIAQIPHNFISISTPVCGTDGDTDLSECIEDQGTLTPYELAEKQDTQHKIMSAFLTDLSNEDRVCLIHRLGIGTTPKSYRQMKNLLGYTRIEVIQCMERAYKVIRNKLEIRLSQ